MNIVKAPMMIRVGAVALLFVFAGCADFKYCGHPRTQTERVRPLSEGNTQPQRSGPATGVGLRLHEDKPVTIPEPVEVSTRTLPGRIGGRELHW